MIKIEKTETYGWEAAIRGMRNPLNSWTKSDTYNHNGFLFEEDFNEAKEEGSVPELAKWVQDNPGFDTCDPFYSYVIGDNDLNLMKRLRKAGTDHRKYMRMIAVYCDITAPLYWWKEFDTYKIGTVANSCSTMHKIQAKEFALDDFSTDHLVDEEDGWIEDEHGYKWCSSETHMESTVHLLNAYRYQYLRTKDKKYWWQMIQLLPSSYNQRRTVMLNYEVLANMYKSRKDHKLDEWRTFCDWIKTLPHSELITGEY